MDTRKSNARALKACIVLCIAVFCCHNAKAESLKEMVSVLKPVTLSYGANTLRWDGHDMLIVRGKFDNGNAWGGDVYTVLVKQDNGNWELVRHQKGSWESVMTNTQPHTEEDAIASVVFMVPKGENGSDNITALYLLETHRYYKISPIESGTAKFTLDRVEPGSDFGILYFNTIMSETSKARYCNSDSAAYHELGIPLPGDGTEFPCLGKQ